VAGGRASPISPGDRVAYYFRRGISSERVIPADKLVKLPTTSLEQGAVLISGADRSGTAAQTFRSNPPSRAIMPPPGYGLLACQWAKTLGRM